MTQRPTISKLDHIAVHVNKLEEARRFYENVLGWAPSNKAGDLISRGIIWYDLPDGRQIHLFATDTELPVNRAHFALNVEDVSGWRVYLTDLGIAFVEPSVQLYNAERLFVRDPSGNLIEFVKWR
jgi:catechol 2,3-dioxygenase-like lactoylglutathione lyase family enzyme